MMALLADEVRAHRKRPATDQEEIICQAAVQQKARVKLIRREEAALDSEKYELVRAGGSGQRQRVNGQRQNDLNSHDAEPVRVADAERLGNAERHGEISDSLRNRI